MEAKLKNIGDFLGQHGVRFMVPIYQRVYAWTEPELRALWADMTKAGDGECELFLGSLFLGSLFFGDEGVAEDGLRVLNIIDGQQRLTTLTLLLCAVRDRLRQVGGTFLRMDADDIDDRFLTVALSGGKGCKLVLTPADAPTLQEIVGVSPDADSEARGRTDDESGSQYIRDCYRWFAERIGAQNFDMESLERGFSSLRAIAVRMGASDQPQTVFESINAKGMPLSVPDLARNALFGHEGFPSPSYLYDAYWARVEDAFSVDEDDRWLAHAIRRWSRANPAVKDERGIFAAFKAKLLANDAATMEKRTGDLASFCLDFHRKVEVGDEATLEECKQWEEGIGKAERLGNGRRIFGD